MGFARRPSLFQSTPICQGRSKPCLTGVKLWREMREGLPHVLLELRQDLIDTHHGAEAWADRLSRLFEDVLE